MKDARYLIRIAHAQAHTPADHVGLLAKVRALAAPLKGKAINLRVTPVALEFDLFCSPEADARRFTEAFQALGEVITCKRLDVPPPPVAPQKFVTEARQLFNEHRFWEVHEVLEGLWKELKGSEKELVQGLILVAAALVHAQKDEMGVMWTMLADALRRLDKQPNTYYGWDIGKFRKYFARVAVTKNLEIPTV
jgi:hypothetical protein